MRSLIKIILILFLTVTSQANEDIKRVEDDIKKAANQIADTLKIEIAIKGKKLTNFFTNNNLVLISEKGTREYKFKDKSYEIIQNNNVIQSGTWKINGLLKNRIRLISNDDKKKYYLKKISRKPWIYNYDKPPGSEGAEKEILHIKSSSKFNEISSDITFAEKEISDTSSKSDKKDKKSDTSIANNRLEEKLNLNIIMQKELYPQWRYSIFTQNLDNKLVVKPEIEELTFNDCFFSNQYLKKYKQLLYLSNDGVNRTIEEIYENNGVINIKENLFNYLKQYLKEEYNFKGKLKRQCAKQTWASIDFHSLSGDYEHQYQILILPKGLKIDKIYTLNSIGQIKYYPLKRHFEHNRFLGVVAEIDINKFNNAYASVNSKAQKSRNDKKNESQLIRSLASKDDRNHVLMYTLKPPSYWKQTYCFINNSNSNKWDPALTAYIHYGYDNFHEDDFTKYINIVANDVKIKDKYNPNINYNESKDTFDFEYRWNSGDEGIIATKDVINELFLGIKSEKYNCTIIIGYPQDLTKIIDALKRDNFFKLEYLPLQGKLRKVSDLNKKYDQVVKIWKEYYENERKRQAMKNQAYQEKYGELINKYPNCATTYYYIKGRMAQFSRNSWQYNKLDALKRNIEGLVSATGSADDPNSRAHCQKFLVMSYNTN